MTLSTPWQAIIDLIAPKSHLRPIQIQALGKGLLSSRRNLVISAPTNAGKSLVGTLALLDAIHQGKRAVLLEPLRALAQEKYEELDALAPQLGEALNKAFRVRIATGDYQLEDEFLSDPPPGGELLIATPERLEALLRRPENLQWFESLGAVVVDEAHMIREPRRGPTLEFLLTSLHTLPAPPRLVLLSATLGDTDDALAWLDPCDLVQVTERHPPLQQEVLALEQGEDVENAVQEWCEEVLGEPDTQVLVFVYQTRSAAKTARVLTAALGDLAGPDGVLAYHSQMARAQREVARKSFVSGRSRVIVTTTALAMGINLPCTHVLVRDNTFFGEERLGVDALRQMLGRAGRGDQEGVGIVLVRPGDGWDAEELAHDLEAAPLPPLQSALQGTSQDAVRSTATLVASLLARREKLTQEELEAFLAHTLGGQALAGHVKAALRWLVHRVLVYEDEEAYALTTLGRRAVRAVMPLEIAAGYTQLLRDLLEVESNDASLAAWRPLDHLVVLELLRERPASIRAYSQALVDLVDNWMEAYPNEVPVLYQSWIKKGRAEEVLGSLGLPFPEKKTPKQRKDWASKQAYLAVFRAVVLYTRAAGMPQTEAARRFGARNLDGIEERWRDEVLWLLSGLSKLLETKVFYYHLRQKCEADDARIKGIEDILKDMRRQVYVLLHDLKYCSPLGPVLRQMRRLTIRGGAKVGAGTIQRLEEAGVTDKASLLKLSEDDLVELGVKRNLAKQIRAFARRASAA